MQDEHGRLKKLTQEAQNTRNLEARLTRQVEKHRSTIARLEKENARLSTQVDSTRKRMAALEQQFDSSSKDAGRQRVHSAKVENQLEELQKELEDWKQQALRAKKKARTSQMFTELIVTSRVHCSISCSRTRLLKQTERYPAGHVVLRVMSRMT